MPGDPDSGNSIYAEVQQLRQATRYGNDCYESLCYLGFFMIAGGNACIPFFMLQHFWLLGIYLLLLPFFFWQAIFAARRYEHRDILTAYSAYNIFDQGSLDDFIWDAIDDEE